MKLFLLWDMEGVSGLFEREQVWFWEDGVRPEVVAEGRRLLMADINHASAAALTAGVDELIVCDTHGGGGNLDLGQMLDDPRITYLTRSRGEQDGRLRWLPGLDETVDGFLLPGHHAKAGTPGAFLPHTWMGEWADFRINGQSVGEPGIEACYAGHWDVPIALVQGDDVACAEAETLFPGVITAGVKTALNHDRCTGPDLDTAHRLMADRVTEAVQALRDGRLAPYQPALPMRAEVEYRTPEGAAKAAARPGVERVDEVTVAAEVQRRCDVVKWVLDTGLD